MATTNPTSHPTMTEEHAIRRPLQSLSINAKNRATSMAVDDSTKGEVLKAQAPVKIHLPTLTIAEMPTEQAKIVHAAPSMEEDEMAAINAIFRQQCDFLVESRDSAEDVDLDSQWTLKRASPVTEDDDEDEFTAYESPSKKIKTQSLLWESRMSDEQPFDLAAMMRAR